MVGKRCALMQLAVICVQSQQSGAAGSVKGDFPCVCEQPTCYTEFSSFTICRISCVTFPLYQESGTFLGKLQNASPLLLWYLQVSRSTSLCINSRSTESRKYGTPCWESEFSTNRISPSNEHSYTSYKACMLSLSITNWAEALKYFNNLRGFNPPADRRHLG